MDEPPLDPFASVQNCCLSDGGFDSPALPDPDQSRYSRSSSKADTKCAVVGRYTICVIKLIM